MVNFFTKADITDSTIINVSSFNMPSEILAKHIKATNKWYEELCNTVGVYGDDIMINDINTVDDERNQTMIEIASWYFLTQVMFPLIQSPDDIYFTKYEIAKSNIKSLRGLVTINKIKGINPTYSKIKLTNSFQSVPIARG